MLKAGCWVTQIPPHRQTRNQTKHHGDVRVRDHTAAPVSGRFLVSTGHTEWWTKKKTPRYAIRASKSSPTPRRVPPLRVTDAHRQVPVHWSSAPHRWAPEQTHHLVRSGQSIVPAQGVACLPGHPQMAGVEFKALTAEAWLDITESSRFPWRDYLTGVAHRTGGQPVSRLLQF